jgi:hypothetical protein
MRSIRIPVGMSDVVILFGPSRARDGVVRALARDTAPVLRTGQREAWWNR